MQVFSAQELDFLNNPDKFSDKYQRVLRCRIRKKARIIRRALLVIEYSKKAMQPNGRKWMLPKAMLN